MDLLTKSIAVCVLLLASYSLAAQTGCSCPPLNTCFACSGGLTYLKMEYTPNNTITNMTASDNDGVLPSTFVSVNKQITINSRISGQPFNGDVVITITKSNNTQNDVVVSTSCSSSILVGDPIQNLKVVEAASVAGPLCCDDSKMDHVKPGLTACPADIPATATPGGCTAIVSWTQPTATDNCGNVTLVSTKNPGDVFTAGTTIVTYTATDDYNNTRTCSFNVVVTEVSQPVISNCPANISISTEASSCSAAVTWIEPTASDCSLTSFTSNHASGSSFPIGITTVTYTATDASNNTATCSFIVTVIDKTSPVFVNCPATINVNADQSCSALVNWPVPIVTDNCSAVSVTSSYSPGSTFASGTTSVTYTATDAAGNLSQCQFDVVVFDATASIVNCPSDIEVMADESGQAIVMWQEPNVISVCGNQSLSPTHSPGDTFPVGITPVTYTLSGDREPPTTCQFNVVVSPIEISFVVTQQVSPNGDGINDTWLMPNIERFKNNKVILLDRWGGLIYEASGYNNESVVWDGNNVKGLHVPTGTYFYTITVIHNSQEVKRKGFIELIR